VSTRRNELIAETTEEVRRQQAAYDRFHDAVAGYLKINRTDLRCLDLLDMRGRLTAGELSEATGLSTGAVTVMLDRLERAGYVRRVRDPGDRRRVYAEPTELAAKYATEVYAPLTAQAAPLYDRYTEDQLATIADFLRTVNHFYGGQIARVEALDPGSA
jgi:DNA-binding MarR family transcriptional regulator